MTDPLYEQLAPDTWFCWRCRMNFRVEAPRHPHTQRTICAVPKCGRLFWHSDKHTPSERVIVCGIWPENVPT